MPSGARSNLFLLALIAGTTVVMFLLGAAVTMWLGIMPPAGAASAPSIISSLGPSPAGSPTDTVPAAASSPGSAPSVTSSLSASPAGSPASPVPPASAKEAAASAVASPAPTAAAEAQANGAGPAASGPARPASVQAGAFSLQFGGFLDAAKAKSLIGELAARGYAPASVDVADGYGQMWHYVRFGGYADERAAALAASDLLQRTGIGAAIVRVSTANAGP